MNKILWDSANAANATDGKATKKWQASGVSIDSRTIAKGDLFIAIAGENFDGHDFVRKAIDNGAAAAMVHYVPDNISEKNDPLLIVNDTFEALRDMASFSRNRMKGKIIAVTGSVGKTSTKEMLNHVLESQGKIFCSKGNFNNHFGLPLSLSRMPENSEYGIFEMGMSAPNEISPLSVIAKPDVAIITTVEAVHLEFFDSVEGIADAKAEIFDGLAQEGTAVLNRDNPHFLRLKKAAEKRKIKNIICFGQTEGADFRLADYKEDGEGSKVTAVISGKEYEYKLGIAGRHQALNSLAVLAAVSAAGGNIEKAMKKFADFEAKDGRGKRHHIKIKDGEITLIDDSYNASPASVSAAIKTLATLNGRKIAVLGDMFELGDGAKEMHVDISKKLVENKIDLVFTAGKLMKNMYEALPQSMRGAYEENSEALAPVVLNAAKNGDVVLVKGSRGMKMEKVVEKLKDAVL